MLDRDGVGGQEETVALVWCLRFLVLRTVRLSGSKSAVLVGLSLGWNQRCVGFKVVVGQGHATTILFLTLEVANSRG